MARLLFFALAFAVIFFFLLGSWSIFRGFSRAKEIARANRKHVEDSYREDNSQNPENMIECDYCGLHTPESETVKAGGKSFCCEDHKRMAFSRDIK
ncbi:PP0621 family protein [Taylorella equigenitalis]|uniref:Uncharacterized protein n=3 Tax=Taylorella equigenitalis TaxID=29575 RepID=A0A654KHJ3_TAYEM|nr:PP0621 family protein [Taylorella equigenitalis]ADU91855.1 hypothetical protein TEQUI_0924 [Taylorella equigenitalis MCE9]AFN35420.1 hypothetical protein KUI_0326 [Taylorella equigenitalis ATCC 35865]ASY30077.1 hypothetical protein B9Z30_01500 [Taylorella equigenitalis]ASY37382.1 hypothetical protein CA605_01455 [Taylorella equigenitalis]ASY38848.1 hypothetical protein CA604_01610 [Taylorella equigenitalis]